ncbi:hypothetical protein QOZ95_002371, partial [Paenibacillus brasilensis]|nr:hypothetical protein [Paenibacillus brasilensis]
YILIRLYKGGRYQIPFNNLKNSEYSFYGKKYIIMWFFRNICKPHYYHAFSIRHRNFTLRSVTASLVLAHFLGLPPGIIIKIKVN